MPASLPARPSPRPWAELRAGTAFPAVFLAVMVVVALSAPLLMTHPPLDQDLLAINKDPSRDHLLGTDHLGRDIYSRLLFGARTTLAISMAGTAVAFAIGAGLGLAALALGRWAEGVTFALIDVVRALPSTLLALLLIVGLGTGSIPLTIALGISFAPLVAYVSRAAYHREAAREYVLAARTFGGGPLHILRRHILPNLSGALVTQAAIIVPRCVVTESVLSFLGLGSSPDAPTWGRMIADASQFIEIAPHALLAPVVALVLMTLSMSVVGNRLREWLDPLRAEEASPTAGAPAHPEPQALIPR